MAEQKPLTERQAQILTYIRDCVQSRGYPPSVREIGDAVGLKSTSSVHAQLNRLHDRGYLRRDPTLPRAIELQAPAHDRLEGAAGGPGTRSVPVLGDIAAGAPIVAEEQQVDAYVLPRALVGDGTLFIVRVRGESMLNAGVCDGDLVVVRQQPTVEQGEMCAALLEEEATVKFFRRTPDGRVFLDPANERFDPIEVPTDGQARILGRVTAVLRSV